MNTQRAKYIYLLILLPLIYFAIFLHLDSRPFRIWDEAYLATHTYEMMHDHDYIVTHSFGKPEMSNTKPPLVIWCMVASTKILGFNELGIRIPNAFAGVAVCFIIFFFVAGVLKSPLKGFLSVLVLISSAGFIRLHVTRSGEYDAFLVLFVTIYILSFFLILENSHKHKNYRQYWWIFTIALTFAILTKGIAAVLIIPGLFIYTVKQKKIWQILKSKEFYFSSSFVCFFGLGYYLLREHFNHGYIKAVFENEIGGRYMNQMFPTPRWVFLDLIANIQLKFWLPFLFIGFFGGIVSSESLERRITEFCAILIVGLLFILTLGSTRLDWYDAPLFPIIAILSGSGIYLVLDFLFKISEDKLNAMKVSSTIILIILFFLAPYYDTIINNLSNSEALWDSDSYNLTHYIELKERSGADINGYKVVPDWSMWRASFCQVKKWEYKTPQLEVTTDISSLKTGDKVILGAQTIKAQIDEKYVHTDIEKYKNIEVWQITGLKSIYNKPTSF